MAKSSSANTVHEGTTLVFGSWACTADGSGGFTGHLIMPKEPEAKLDDQPAETAEAPKLDEKLSIQTSPALDFGRKESSSGRKDLGICRLQLVLTSQPSPALTIGFLFRLIHQGVPGGRVSGRGFQEQELNGNTETRGLDRFGPQ